MKKRFFFLFLVLAAGLSVHIFALDFPQISAECAVLYDADYDFVLFEKAADQRHEIASTTKIMTALLSLEQYNPSEEVRIQPEWCGIEGSSLYLQPGETLSVSDLLYGLMLQSGNDAAAALAGYDPEGYAGFLRKMNACALAIGLENTHFTNPSGLPDPEHYSTALDMPKLTAEALKNPLFTEIVATKYHGIGNRRLKNHNRLLWEPDFCGVKTGYTKAAGRCLVSSKQVKGRTLICVTLNDPDDWRDHKALYYFAEENLRELEPISTGHIDDLHLISSVKTEVPLYCAENFSCFLTDKEARALRIRQIRPRFLYGAVCAGELCGRLEITLNGRLVFRTDLCISESSAAAEPPLSLPGRLFQYFFRRRTF